jgi:hypothetical protein
MTPQEESERRRLLKMQRDQALSAKAPWPSPVPSVPSEHVIPLLHYGECMANICFNGQQDARIPYKIRQAMARCQTAWDIARRPATEEVRRQELDGSLTEVFERLCEGISSAPAEVSKQPPDAGASEANNKGSQP